MPSSLEKLDVWNLALDHLIEKPLATDSDDSPYARWLTRNWDHMRDALTRMYLWNFAMQYNSLSVDPTDPAFRWDHRYALPTDWLRIVPPTNLGQRGSNPIPHEVVGNYIYCNVDTTLYLRTIQRTTDTTAWDPIAIDALGLFLAERMAYRFSKHKNLRTDLRNELQSVLQMAVNIDAIETTAEPIEQHTVLDVRDL